ncbi:Acetyl-coenzyme A carboxylase carboxyl transferase subunit alpha [Rhynchospora pubera]|uniref:acetyl-CoA carboxytransferase n=1 Tax=Rhynchospora pubera TaxID=906938 RepID=A0AAV8FBB9_9POAL|nr:Acetyl-coenzyme A carboxylase carboxyl transferase subunit alpha [Rhynchospora pubera]
MSSLSLAHAIGTQKIRSFISGSYANPFLGGTGNGCMSVSVSVPHLAQNRVSIRVLARKGKKKHERPWPDLNEIDPEWKPEHLMHLSPYKPLKEKPRMLNLQFEKPILKLKKRLDEVKEFAKTSKHDLTELVESMEARYYELASRFYAALEPIERVHIARHPQRPTFLDHVINMTDRWIELHGDRAGYDDPAIVCCLGSMEGQTYMFIGQQKGRNSKENIKRNFGMPTPHGYRKALRFMRYAEKHGFPIITFVDTPGAFADLKSEELNQGEAIANNLRSMFGIKVPIITVVIGEGGSGGALAIACSNKILMLENAVFFVASPEACAAILYKSAKEASKAAEKLKITAAGLKEMGVCDYIVPEPLGGAHRDPALASKLLKIAILRELAVFRNNSVTVDHILFQRKLKFRKIGKYKELDPVDPAKLRNMKRREVPYSAFNYTDPTPYDKEQLEAALEDVKTFLSEEEIEHLISDENLKKLEKELDVEWNKALFKLGLYGDAKTLHKEIGEVLGDPYAEGELPKELQKKVDRLGKSLCEQLARPETVPSLRAKFQLYHFALNLRIFLLNDDWKDVEDDKDDEEDENQDDVKMESAFSFLDEKPAVAVVAGKKKKGRKA